MASSTTAVLRQPDRLVSEHLQTVPFEPKLKSIMLCTDFSLASESATATAINLSKSTGATLSVLHINEYGECAQPCGNNAACIKRKLQAIEQSLKDVAEHARKEGITVDAFTVTGFPPISIVESIAARGPDLAIMGTNGIKGFERMVFGSTAESVFRHAACPVLVVGPGASNKRKTGSGPVVFATDFHEPARLTARYAFALAQIRSLPLHCIHVLPLTAENERHHSALTSIMEEALRGLTKEIPKDSCELSYNVLFDSEISHAIVSYAAEHNAEYIVLGVRRGFTLSPRLPPHLTYRMIATAPCPVLTISPETARPACDSSIPMYGS